MTRHSARTLVVAALVLTACTTAEEGPSATDSHPNTTTVPSTTTTTIAVAEATEEFGQCLDGQGVAIDPVPFDAIGRPRLDLATSELDFDDPEVTDALALCAPILGTGALDLSGEEALRAMIFSQLEAFARCVRDRGVALFPDPVPGFSGVGSPFSVAEIPYSHPGFEVAVTVCRDQVLSALPGTGGS